MGRRKSVGVSLDPLTGAIESTVPDEKTEVVIAEDGLGEGSPGLDSASESPAASPVVDVGEQAPGGETPFPKYVKPDKSEKAEKGEKAKAPREPKAKARKARTLTNAQRLEQAKKYGPLLDKMLCGLAERKHSPVRPQLMSVPMWVDFAEGSVKIVAGTPGESIAGNLADLSDEALGRAEELYEKYRLYVNLGVALFAAGSFAYSVEKTKDTFTGPLDVPFAVKPSSE